jgi:hypothetical protein
MSFLAMCSRTMLRCHVMVFCERADDNVVLSSMREVNQLRGPDSGWVNRLCYAHFTSDMCAAISTPFWKVHPIRSRTSSWKRTASGTHLMTGTLPIIGGKCTSPRCHSPVLRHIRTIRQHHTAPLRIYATPRPRS